MAAVRRFIEGFNGDDVDLALTACADETTIIDDFPPHHWFGPGAAGTWYREMARMATGYGMSDWSVTLHEPSMEVVSDRNAYLVVPVGVRWLQDGAPTERPGFMTLSLLEQAEGWRISTLAWTWSS